MRLEPPHIVICKQTRENILKNEKYSWFLSGFLVFASLGDFFRISCFAFVSLWLIKLCSSPIGRKLKESKINELWTMNYELICFDFVGAKIQNNFITTFFIKYQEDMSFPYSIILWRARSASYSLSRNWRPRSWCHYRWWLTLKKSCWSGNWNFSIFNRFLCHFTNFFKFSEKFVKQPYVMVIVTQNI